MTKNLRLALLFFVSSLLVTESAIAQTRLGLHVTQEELNIWRQRTTNGPYRVKGDVSTNSPGDWTHIVQQKDAFMANLSSSSPPYYWSGPPNIGRCFTHNDPYFAGSGPSGGSWHTTLGDPVMKAAFYSLVMNDSVVRTAVRNNLIATAAESTLNFANSTLWCVSTANDIGMHWGYALWLLKLIHAYDFIRPNLSAQDKNTLDTWFLNIGSFHAGWTTRQAKEVWVDPDAGNYTLASGGSWQCADTPAVAYFNGPIIQGGQRTIINRKSHAHHLVAAVGVMLDDPDLKNRAKKRFEEYIKFGVFPQGAAMDFDRWQDGPPTQGWRYAGAALQSYAAIADIFGRAGDLSLLNYSTSAGWCSGSSSTAGGPKSLGNWISQYVAYVQSPGPFTRYGTDSSTSQNATYLLRSTDGIDGQGSVRDTYSVSANLYYQNATVKSIYLRQASNTPPYPSNPESGGYYPWGGAGGIWPGLLFMFGQMEGQVWPYPTGGSQLPTINFASNPSTIPTGQSSTLIWSTNNATSCSASGGWTGTKSTSGTQSVTPTQTTTYTLSCAGSGGSSNQSTTVSVSLPAPAAPTGLSIVSQ